MPQDQASVLLQDVSLAYGAQEVLRGLTLSVPAGSITALLGGNGAGKSTTLAALLGFVRAQSGTILVCGVDPGSDPDGARRRIAYLPENVALYEHLSATENAEYLLALSGEQHARRDITEAFAAAGLQEEAWDQRLGGFSKGMRQKVAIAVALLRRVPVLLLDEPTSGLDPRATADFNALVAQVRDRGTAVLMVTHDLLSAADVADRIAFLENGRVTDEVAASGPERFDVRALHARFQVGGEPLAA
ncbi:ATP-binding cassette domain-containing protein [Sphingomonas koreensis]|uniref:ABC transporter ATP-binding protein n=1 Tax=Sphingomonas koreensis TaxID=93064 RepID=UPI000829D7B4|nr:ATP-binding cassette domain-containing protein [Sphingomonas koreensis]PJI87251.1 ABC-2 type transport system ATP-binding protein [Sphingomonas koreensis]RSU59625.1 ATP-binding cassette domain-containing protein [Sphingomonas koreensis]RSU68781.1 ATP-binding cassette domain-containing protein [Sphingomonas koreensis]